MSFRLLTTCPETSARAGVLGTAHGDLPTPAFMPVGTLAAVKALAPRDVADSGAHCVLANAYHLSLRPGADVIERLGGLHRFMGWEHAILTDSGGYQVFSLSAMRDVRDDGISFTSHLDGTMVEMTPERVIQIEEQLGADIIMPLDVCVDRDATRSQVERSVDLTTRWLERSVMAARKSSQMLFGIVQGGVFPDLRRQSARAVLAENLCGYAIGGLSIGETPEVTAEVLAATLRELPVERPRYLMGVGTPEQLLEYIGLGVDLFDCVLPTRLGRTGLAFTTRGRVNVKNASLLSDPSPLDPDCDCLACSRYSRAFLHRAFRERLPVGARLLTMHNTRLLLKLAGLARKAVLEGGYATFQRRTLNTLRLAADSRTAGAEARLVSSL